MYGVHEMMRSPVRAGSTRLARFAYTLPMLVVALLVAACDVPSGPSSAGAQDAERVVVHATNPAGVPLHPEERSRALSGRLADGAEVVVVRWADDRGWLEVRASDGTQGWISARYTRPPPTTRPTTTTVTPGSPDPWASRESCLAALAALPSRDAGRVRIASWNLRWFPDGSSNGPSETPTDVEWAACILASLRVDAVALQEIQLHDRGVAAIERIRERLAAHTGGRWEARFDACPRDNRQHVGWLVDVSRARIVDAAQVDAINPQGGCSHHLRPGLAVYLRFEGGLDASLLVTHLDSGRSPRDHGNRVRSVEAIGRAATELAERHGDADVLVLGDLNTMGCDGCTPAVDAAAELDALDAALAARIRRVQGAVPCTEYYRGRGSLLDHVLVTRATAELAPDARLEAHGPCAQHRCQLPRGVRPPMLTHLSDHCPVVVELDGADRD